MGQQLESTRWGAGTSPAQVDTVLSLRFPHPTVCERAGSRAAFEHGPLPARPLPRPRMARHLGTRLDSAVNRLYRLLRNERIDYTELASSWAKLLAQPRQRELLISIDWTEWHHEIRMLVAAVVTGKRAIPIFAQAFKKLVRLRSQSDGAISVRVIGYRAPRSEDAWWLATSVTGRASRVIQLYDRRMTIEEQFRDIKGRRFGVKLFWTQFRAPEALARFAMLLAVALLVWMATGFAAARLNPSLRLISRRKGPRQSYVTIGLRCATAGEPAPRPFCRNLRKYLEPPAERPLGRRGIGGAK